jgi:hypothetical protein
MSTAFVQASTASLTQPEIGTVRVKALLEVDAIAENDGAVECEARLRAVPGDELANRVLVRPLALVIQERACQPLTGLRIRKVARHLLAKKHAITIVEPRSHEHRHLSALEVPRAF